MRRFALAAVTALASTPLAAQQPSVVGKSFNQLPVAGVLSGGEILPVMQNGVTKQVPVNALYSLLTPALVTNQSVLGAIGYTPPNKAGDTILGNNFFVGPSFSLNTARSADFTSNFAALSANGNAISYASTVQYVLTPNADHQRGTLVVRSTTSDDGHSQENTFGLDTIIVTGASKSWAANTSFSPGDNIASSSANTVYRMVGASGCTSAASGTGPSGTGSGIADGTCTWTWINAAAIDGKVGFFNGVNVLPGAGASWAQSNDLVIRAGATASAATNVELDVVNLGLTSGVGKPPVYGLNIGMTGDHLSLAGAAIGSSNATTNATLIGLWVNGPHLASQADIEDDASAADALLFQGLGAASHSDATIRDNSSGTRSLAIYGTYSVASIDDEGASPAGLLIGPRHTSGQIIGQGWSVDLAGNLTIGNLTAKVLTEASTVLMTTTTTFGNGAAAQTATLTNGPTAGNPTKWIPINDNGTTRYIPAW